MPVRLEQLYFFSVWLSCGQTKPMFALSPQTVNSATGWATIKSGIKSTSVNQTRREPMTLLLSKVIMGSTRSILKFSHGRSALKWLNCDVISQTYIWTCINHQYFTMAWSNQTITIPSGNSNCNKQNDVAFSGHCVLRSKT